MKRSGFNSAKHKAALKSGQKRLRKCKVCWTCFEVERVNQVVCGDACALEKVRLDREKEERKALRAVKAATKPMKDRLKSAQSAANGYVRIRDFFDSCCSCDKGPYWDGQWHASHFKSVGSNSLLRFHLWNIHKSCSECNVHKHGNIHEYRARLEKKIGAERVQWLDDNKNGTRKYTPEWLDRFTRIFNKKTKRLEKRIANETVS